MSAADVEDQEDNRHDHPYHGERCEQAECGGLYTKVHNLSQWAVSGNAVNWIKHNENTNVKLLHRSMGNLVLDKGVYFRYVQKRNDLKASEEFTLVLVILSSLCSGTLGYL